MDIVDKLTEIFKDFPGIGERQARRFVYYLMRRNGDYAKNLAALVLELKKEVTQCTECFRFFIVNKSGAQVCDICSDPNTDSSLLMVIEKDSDLESMRKSGVYGGKYFILGGLVPIIEKTTKSRVRIEELKNRIIKDEKKLKEIILAFSLSPQGDHTQSYVRGELQNLVKSITISTLGRGLSTGTELEYSDNDTLRNALKNRQ